MEPTTNLKKEWDISLLYSSHDEAEKDLSRIEEVVNKFEKKYKGKTSWLEDASSLLKALKDYEGLMESTISKPARYFNYLSDLNSADAEVESRMTKVEQKLTDIENKLIFFTLVLGKVSEKKQKAFLKDKTLAPYKYFLEDLFKHAKYTLSESEEKILNLLSLPSYALWVQGVEKGIGKLTVKVGKNELPLPAALNKIPELETTERRRVWNSALDELEKVSDFAESEINAIVIQKKVRDELRGLKEPYEGTLLAYQNDKDTIEELVETVTKAFSISRDFYKLKRDLLKLPSLTYADRAAKFGAIKRKFTYEHSYELLEEAFGDVDPEFKSILNRMSANGQIDVFPKVGKRGGAYCSGTENLPTYVLLNHADTFDSYRTFAHEMGHAIHTEFSKTQPVLYQGYTISVAEVASTFFENFAFERIFKELTPEEKIIALHDNLNSSISTIFRQVALFNFELELHNTIREKGKMQKEEIMVLMNKHMGSYLGDAVELTPKDGLFFVDWPHIRYFFYVYSYAYGELISNALYEKYLENPEYINEVKKFLSRGGSTSPYEIFREIGIDTKDPEFWKLGLSKVKRDIATLKRLAKKAGMLE